MLRYRWCAAATIPLAGIALVIAIGCVIRLGASLPTLWPLLTLVAGLPAIVLGNLIATRRPEHRIGPLLAWTGLVVSGVGTVDAYGLLGGGGRLPGGDIAVSLAQGTWMWLYVPVAVLMLFFPTGRLPGRRWRAVLVALPVTTIMFMLLAATLDGPYVPPFEGGRHALGTVPAALAPLGGLLLLVFLGLLVASAVSMVRRYRRADGIVRAQLRWFALAGLTLPGTLILCWTSYLLLDQPGLVGYGVVTMLWGIAAAVAIAIIRHDLFDIDRILSATVTYTLVSACVVGVFALATTVLGVVTGGRSTVVTALATAASAAALAPAHRWIRTRAYRRLYPERERVLAAVEDLEHRTHAGTARPEDLAATLRTAMGDPQLQVGYLPPGGGSLIDPTGRALLVAGHRTDIVAGDQRRGALVLSRPRPPELSREIALAVAPLVELVALRLELRTALADAESSRGRLLRAGYEERRKVVHDLHDGSQQRLVSLGMSLRLAQRHLDEGSVDVDGLLDHSVAELGSVVAELRQLANGLRPSCLDDGLDSALRQLTAGVPLASSLDLRTGTLADDVSTTAYFVASEALANAVKHSAASTLGVVAVQRDGKLEIRISDDGQGGAALRSGHGLSGLADRVSACGGTLSLSSPPGSGTVVEALLPCGS